MFYHFSPSNNFLGTLKRFTKINKKRQNKIIRFHDNLAFGPLGNIFDEKILQKRCDFLYKNLEFKQTRCYSQTEFLKKEDEEKYFKKYFFDIKEDYFPEIYKEFLKEISEIKETDKIFIYLEHTAESYLFLSYFLNIYSGKNFKVYFLPKNLTKTFENGVKLKLNLGVLDVDDLENIFRNGENLSEKEEKYFKNLIFEVPENNILRILKNKKIVELPDDFLDEEILKIFKNDFIYTMRLMGDFFAKYNKKEFFSENIFGFILNRLEKMGKIESKIETKIEKSLLINKKVKISRYLFRKKV